MKNYNLISSIVMGSVALCAAPDQIAFAQGAAANVGKPFQFYVTAGATQDDNLFRLNSSSDGEALLGTSELSDWYRFIGVGFESLIARENQRFELLGNVKRWAYEEFDELDHTSGRFRGVWHWKASSATQGNVGYRFRRELRSFTNQNVPKNDIIEENAIFAEIERQVAQRWLLRVNGESTDLNFSASPLLQKQRNTIEAELRYAASQQSSFGLLSTYTQSTFDESQSQDFSGWSVGPLFHWQPQQTLSLTANVAYTHQGLDESQPDVDDFDGLTGFAAAKWALSDSIDLKLRVFHDISDLGGEVANYTERTGTSIEATWQITPKLTSRAQLEYQTRDFIASPLIGVDREDDYVLAELWLDFSVAPRWLLSFGLGKENRDSNVDIRNFDDTLLHANIRFDF